MIVTACIVAGKRAVWSLDDQRLGDFLLRQSAISRTIEPTHLSDPLYFVGLPMIFQLTVAAICVAILLVGIAIFRHLVWLGKKRKQGQSLFLLDTLTEDQRPGKSRKRRP